MSTPRSEPTCNVPQLEPDDRVLVPLHNFECEVYADRGPVVLAVGSVNVAANDAGLARAQLTDDQHFVEVVAKVHGLNCHLDLVSVGSSVNPSPWKRRNSLNLMKQFFS